MARRGARERRIGVLAVAGSVAANLLLFLAIAWANASPASLPKREDWFVREVFQAAPPPQEPTAAEEAPLAEAEESPLPPEPAPLETPTERFDLRLDLPPVELQAPRLSAPAIRFDPGPPGATSVAPGRPLELGQVDRPPQRAVAPLPPYPAWARIRRLEGVVTLRFTVDADGAARDVEVERIDGDARFGEIAREAVRTWTFEPAVADGRKVACVIVQRVRFQLVDR
jgi:protein TonB